MNELDQINLREFYGKTRPQYLIRQCHIGKYSCKRDFKFAGGYSKGYYLDAIFST